MTMGPAPMIRMLSRSVRLGILVHQRDKPLKQIVTVLWTRARLGMVLHRKYRLTDDPQAFVAVVEQRNVGRLNPLRQTGRIDHKSMVLASNLDLAGGEVLDRVVGAAVAARHLAGGAAER